MLRTYVRSLRFLSYSARRMFGKFPRECSLCGYSGKFLGYGYPYVCDIYCPKCGSLERHRLIALAEHEMNFFRGRDVLHFAPEIGISTLVKDNHPKSYVTADLFAPNVDRKENIEALTINVSNLGLALRSEPKHRATTGCYTSASMITPAISAATRASDCQNRALPSANSPPKSRMCRAMA